MVGNSLKSDIMPVVNIGGRAVHIPHEIAWFHEDISDTEREKIEYAQLDNLGQVVAYVERLAESE